MANQIPIDKALQSVMSHHVEVERAQSETAEAKARLNSCECARSNATSDLAKAIADLPDPILRDLCCELDRAIPKSKRPTAFVVREPD